MTEYVLHQCLGPNFRVSKREKPQRHRWQATVSVELWCGLVKKGQNSVMIKHRSVALISRPFAFHPGWLLSSLASCHISNKSIDHSEYSAILSPLFTAFSNWCNRNMFGRGHKHGGLSGLFVTSQSVPSEANEGKCLVPPPGRIKTLATVTVHFV